ncbi:translation initiation factor IF-2 [uncultured Aquimonas sp.]|uniref:translation initiation factor IF-2 n=1 Tax=uncultured Aquimonas sp. TaxID=385483 RepID=UPI00086C946F|nr:translation initiation factor IF-2 [uncultured Aquimonas sp.]ODU46649.1 MAG: translation initiation factor IF-2 [Xanthomonadaceae bacterium SCN 69-123]
MSEVTVRTLAKLTGTPVEKLLEQLAEAGMSFSGPDQVVTSAEKMKLLGFLRRTHGKTEPAEEASAPRQITLKRRKVEEITVAAGKQKTTVNVEVRQKRTYVKRSEISTSEDPGREEAQRLLAESQARQEAEEAARIEAEQRKAAEAERQREEEEARRRAAEAPAAVEASAPVPEPAPAVQTPAAVAPAASTPSVRSPAPSAPTSRPAPRSDSPSSRPPMRTGAPSGPGAPRPAGAPPRPGMRPSGPGPGAAPPPPAGPARGRDDRRARPARGAPARPGGDDAASRFGRGELHLSDAGMARRGARKKPGQRRQEASRSGGGSHAFSRPLAPMTREVAIGDTIVVADLAQKLAMKGAEVVKALFKMGVMATINQTIDHDTAVLVVEELGHTAVRASENDVEDALIAHVEQTGEGELRPPVVTIMGHVDHGKTSLLDHIRRTRVASGEAGGITQHIGAYHVETPKGVISFLDTPGHSAFTQMRARGAKLTDIVVLVVAADDGVMPQTVEAIKHAKAAGVPLIVAINKMDKSDANPDNVKQGLANHEVIPEEWGGDTQFVPVSAKTGMGIDTLLDAISIQAEVMELRAVVDGRANGAVIESSLDKGRGPVATVLVQAGTLKKGDFVVCGTQYGRVRALFDEAGRQVEAATPSIPVVILGLSGVPDAGDDFVVVEDERLAKDVAQQREAKKRESRLVKQAGNRMEDIMAQMGQGEGQQTLNLVVKADVQGSVEALRDSLTSLSNDMIRINVIASGVGGINESDATLAAASKAVVIGFNVRADAAARRVIEANGLDLRYFSIIYDVIDQVKQVASGLLGVEIREEIIGTAEVREVFRSSKFGAVAGSMVIEGVVRRNKPIRVLRNNTVIFQGELESLRRFKEIVDEVRIGTECGIAVKQYNDVKPGDQIECYERIEVQRTL